MNRQAGAKRGSNLVGVREYNERLILQTVRMQGAIPKAQIARLTGLTAQTVSTIVSEFEAEGLLRRLKPQKGKVGQPSVPFEINPDGALSIGVHIGRRSTEMILTNLTGQIIVRAQEVYTHPDPHAIAAFVGKTRKAFARRQVMKTTRLIGVGVCKPTGMDGWQAKLGAPAETIQAWREIDFHQLIDEQLGEPAVYVNDASAACAAELLFGQGGALPNHLYFYLGSFIGGGLVLNGNLFSGPTGNAAALASLPMPGGHQLIDKASLLQLEERVVTMGAEPTTLWKSPAAWNQYRDSVQAWIANAAPAIAMAALSGVALLELDGVIIDGAVPEQVRTDLVQAVNDCILEINREGLGEFDCRSGQLASDARALGSAAMPLLASFSPNHESLLKS